MTSQDLVEKLKRHPVQSLCGAVLLVCFLAYYFRMDVISELAVALEEVTERANQVDDNVVAGSALEEQLGTIRGMAADLDRRVVRQAELAENLKYFYRLESETGVALADLRQSIPGGKRGEKTGFVPVGYNLLLSGSFPQVVAYFDELENGERFYRLSNFNLQRGRDTNQSAVTLALNLELLGLP